MSFTGSIEPNSDALGEQFRAIANHFYRANQVNWLSGLWKNSIYLRLTISRLEQTLFLLFDLRYSIVLAISLSAIGFLWIC
ncbi:MAG: hypothetical protein DCF19_04870 [Pseudanabaena frigida]|uniref:Uncharacterized protein n=1 Tax=Pseudanabaena frigida TaxID=945775 RepID=A0A2W4WEG4_9CYAN|nr:MAG: hypothetical protein DCF19_04870 [Pseudanabaena frigida]